MRKFLYLTAILISGYLAYANYKDSHIEYELARSEGIHVSSIVTELQGACHRRNNRISVLFNNRTYSIPISKIACQKKKYQIGMPIEVIYVSQYDRLFIENSAAKFNYYLSFLFFLFPLAFLIQFIKSK